MKNKLINLVLVLLVISGTFLVLEYCIGNFLITKTPIKFQFSLPRALAVLAQSSKDGRIPHDYIAIAGDSYAQGKGDWILDIDPNSNNGFHSAHVLQELTGRDVISFGKSGASNIEGWVREPVARYQFIHDYIDDSIEPPQVILAYFYAGNDLMENVVELRQRFIPVYGEDALDDDEAWQTFLDDTVNNYKVGPFNGSLGNLGWFPRAIFKVIKNEFKQKKAGPELGDIPQIRQAGKINSVWIDGKQVSIPDNLQSPALELSPDETELGFLAFTKSLTYLKNYFSDSQIIVVYLPSVIESYEDVSEQISISNILTKKQETLSSFELMQRSDEIADRVKTITELLGLAFIDTRPEIRTASTQQLIHGPIDWKHFNRKGYEVLAQSIFCGLVKNNILGSDDCLEN